MESRQHFHQFIYGKFQGGKGEYQIVAHTERIQEDILSLSEMESIVRNRRFWGAYPPQGENVAVGVFPHEVNQKHYIVLCQVQPPSGRIYRSYLQHRYIFLPVESLEHSGYRTFSLLEWLFKQRIPSVLVNDPYSSAIHIKPVKVPVHPDMSDAEKKEIRVKEAKAILKCCEEVNSKDIPFLLQAIEHIVSGKKILISSASGFPPPEKTYLPAIPLLLPLYLRRSLSIVVGNLDIQECSWANLAINIFSPERVEARLLPKNHIWLNRKKSLFYDRNSSMKARDILAEPLAEEEYLEQVKDSVTSNQALESLMSLLSQIDTGASLPDNAIYTLDDYGIIPDDEKISLIKSISRSANLFMRKLKKKCASFGGYFEDLYSEIRDISEEGRIDVEEDSFELASKYLEEIVSLSESSNFDPSLTSHALVAFFSPSDNLCIKIYLEEGKTHDCHDVVDKPKLSVILRSLLHYFQDIKTLIRITETVFAEDKKQEISVLFHSFCFLKEKKIAKLLIWKWSLYCSDNIIFDFKISPFLDWMAEMSTEEKCEFLSSCVCEFSNKIGSNKSSSKIASLFDMCLSRSKPLKMLLSLAKEDGGGGTHLVNELTLFLKHQVKYLNGRTSSLCFLALCSSVGIRGQLLASIVESMVNSWVTVPFSESSKAVVPSIKDISEASRLSLSFYETRDDDDSQETVSFLNNSKLLIILRLRNYNCKNTSGMTKANDQYAVCNFIDSIISAGDSLLFSIYRDYTQENEEYRLDYELDMAWLTQRNPHVKEQVETLLHSLIDKHSIALTQIEQHIIGYYEPVFEEDKTSQIYLDSDDEKNNDNPSDIERAEEDTFNLNDRAEQGEPEEEQNMSNLDDEAEDDNSAKSSARNPNSEASF